MAPLVAFALVSIMLGSASGHYVYGGLMIN